MATNNRDVKMTLSVETLGAEDIKKLQASVLSLAKEAGDAAPEFEKLAAEIGQLGSQADALRSFETLAAKVTEAAQAQEQAAAKAADLKAKYDQLQGSTDEARARQEAATKAWLDARSNLDQLTADLRTLRQTTDSAAKSTDEYKQAVRDSQQAQADQTARVRELNEARKIANRELTEAEAAERRAARASEQSADAAERNQRALAAQQTELKKLGDELDALGLSSQNVAASQAQLLQAVNATGRAAQQAADAARESARVQAESAEIRARWAKEAAEEDRLAALQSQALARQRAQAAAEEQGILRDAESARKKAYADRVAALERLAQMQRDFDADGAAREQARTAESLARAQAALDAETAATRAAYEQREALARESARQTEAAARQSAQALADAFGSIGIRNVQEVNGEIEQVRRSMQLVAQQSGLTGSALAEAMSRGTARINELQREVRELSGQLTIADRAADLFKNSMGQIAAGNLIADAIGSIIEKVKDMGRQFFTANIEIERLTRTMTLVTGSSEAAAEKIKFLRDTANLAGQSVGEITDSFIRFQASALAAGISSERVDTIFKQVAVSGGKLGLTSEQVSGSLEALSQIAGKGTLSLEELRGQLGDRLPGAVAIAAKGFGYTTDELGKFIKQVESGKVGADEFFQAFIKGLEDFAGSTNEKVGGLLAAYNRLGNAFKQLAQEAKDSQFLQILTTGMDSLASNLRNVVDLVFSLGKAFVAVKVVQSIQAIQLAGVTASATLSTAFATLRTAASTAWAAVGGPLGLAAVVAVNAKEIGTWLGEAVARIQGYGKAIDALAKQEEEWARKQEENAKARARAEAERSASDAKALRSASEARAAAEANLTVTEKGTKSAEEQAKAIKQLSEITDIQSEKLRLSIQASEVVLEAKEREVAASQRFVRSIEDELAAIEKRRDANGKLSGALEEQRKKTQELLNQKREMLARTNEEVEAAKSEVLARETASEAYKDNSKRVEELRLKYEEARRAYEAMAKSGAASNEQLAAAARNVANATTLYRDSLKDLEALQARIFEQTKDKATLLADLRQKYIDAQAAYKALATSGTADAQQLEEAQKRLNAVQKQYNEALEKSQEKLKLVTDTKLSEISVTKATLQVALEEARSQEAFARAKGDEKAVRQAVIRQKEIELELTKLEIQSQRLAAEGSIAVAKAKMAELQALDQLTPAKKLELETTIKLAEVQLRMANVRENSTRLLQDQINALRSNKEVLDGEKNAVDKNTESWAKNVKEREKAIQLAKAAKGEFAYDEQGYRMNADGSRASYELPSEVLKTNDWMSNMDSRTGLPVVPWDEWLKKRGVGGDMRAPLNPSYAQRGLSVADANKERAAAMQQPAPSQPPPAGVTNLIPRPEGMRVGETLDEFIARVYPGSTLQDGTQFTTPPRSGMPGPDIPPPKPAVSSAPRTININLGGKQTSINVASQQDENALIALLQQLEGAAGRAGG